MLIPALKTDNGLNSNNACIRLNNTALVNARYRYLPAKHRRRIQITIGMDLFPPWRSLHGIRQDLSIAGPSYIQQSLFVLATCNAVGGNNGKPEMQFLCFPGPLWMADICLYLGGRAVLGLKYP